MDVISIDEARALVANQALWPYVRDFLWDFVPQIHESWIEDILAAKNAEGARNGERGLCDLCVLCGREKHSPRVKQYILDLLHIEPCFHTFPKDDFSRLLLLDGATLESIAKWLGALACADSLRRVTSGATVRELKAALPGVYPEVFGYTAYFDLAAKNAKSAKNAEDVSACGCELLFSALAGLPSSLVSRLKLKLPKNLCDLCVLCGKKDDSAFSIRAIRKLLKLRFPEAYSLCCL